MALTVAGIDEAQWCASVHIPSLDSLPEEKFGGAMDYIKRSAQAA